MKKKYFLAALILLCALLFSCAKPEPSPPPEPTASETPAVSETPPEPVNIAYDLPEEEYRQLIDFLYDMARWVSNGDDNAFATVLESNLNLLNFGLKESEGNYDSWYYHYFATSADKVEEILNRYFGVEKVRHESYGSIAITGIFEEARYANIFTELPVWFGYRNGEYRQTADYYYGANLPNVSAYFDNGDGTFTAQVDLYSCANINRPENWDTAPADKWFLVKPTNTLTIGDAADGEFDITKKSSFTAVIRPFEDSYQIVSINGKAAPKELAFDGYGEAEKFPESLKSSVFNKDNQIAYIKDMWTKTQDAIKAKECEKTTFDIAPHVVYYTFPELDVTRVDVQKGVNGIEYSRIYIFDGDEPIFAYLSGEDAHRIYYFNDYAFRYAYTPAGGEQVTYDFDFSGIDVRRFDAWSEPYNLRFVWETQGYDFSEDYYHDEVPYDPTD
ncbi:MAG: hypothetical protein LBO63_05775 [Oscillospiraceae bacterium]|jgi:hypothetical protein|nr:hypothetical protein [Oscillospiraceae bacterium]